MAQQLVIAVADKTNVCFGFYDGSREFLAHPGTVQEHVL